MRSLEDCQPSSGRYPPPSCFAEDGDPRGFVGSMLNTIYAKASASNFWPHSASAG